MRNALPLALLALLALGACERKAEPKKAPEPAAPVVAPLTGFTHDPAFDAAGYFRPVNNIVINGWRLNHIALGAPSDFAAWESGRRDGLFGPMILQFDDPASPVETNELGMDAHTVTVRLLPASYQLDRDTIAFRATDPKLGAVAFDGAFASEAFTEARKTGSSGNTPVLIGALSVGEHRIANQRFTYWEGD